jgi:hypothetical protein
LELLELDLVLGLALLLLVLAPEVDRLSAFEPAAPVRQEPDFVAREAASAAGLNEPVLPTSPCCE